MDLIAVIGSTPDPEMEQLTKMKSTTYQTDSAVDTGLVKSFLNMSPEERLRSNDNAVRAVLEMRNAYQTKKEREHRSQRTS